MEKSGAESGLIITRKYDTTYNSYDELYSNEQFAKYNEVLKLLEERFSEKTLLDAGCGTGLFLQYIVDRSMHPNYYVGIDLSKGMLSIFKKRLTPWGKGVSATTDIVRGDIRFLPFRDSIFDITISVTVLNNIEENELSAVINQLKRVTKTTVVISILNLPETMGKIKVIKASCRDPLSSVLKELFFRC